MSWLLDVNLLLASRWISHPDHAAAQKWLASVDQFYNSAITELGFVRISLSKAYGATWDETLATLGKFQQRPGYHFLADDVDGRALPETGSKDTTDAHLVTLAKRHGLKLATLDESLLVKPWSAGVAQNPLVQPVKKS